METISKCPICNNSDFSIFLNCKDFTTSNEVFKIDKCHSCGFLFTNPRPNANEILKYYDSPEYISHTNSNKGLINSIYQKVKRYSISKKYQLIRNLIAQDKFSILDIGCGTGDFLKYCQNNIAECLGVEPNPKAREYSIETNKVKTLQEEDIDSISPNSFDVITMWHVLEHVHELNTRIQQLHRIVKSKGFVIIALPNPQSFDASHYKEFWAGYDVPRHLYHFLPENVIQLLETANFKHINTKPMIFDSFYISILSEKYKNNKGNILKAFTIGFISYINAILKKDKSSSQIYIFQKN